MAQLFTTPAAPSEDGGSGLHSQHTWSNSSPSVTSVPGIYALFWCPQGTACRSCTYAGKTPQ